MRRLLPLLALILLPTSSALASPASERLARIAGVTNEQAEKDIAAQEGAAGIVEAVSSALGSKYAGVYFNNATGKFAIRIAPGANKEAAKAAVGQTVATYPLAEHTLTEVKASVSTIEGELAGLVAEGKAEVVADEKANKARVYYASSLSSGSKEAVKTSATRNSATASSSPKTLIAQPDACEYTYPREHYAGYCEDAVLGGVTMWSEPRRGPEGYYLSYYGCSTGYLVKAQQQEMVLTAGHCGKDSGYVAWLPRKVYGCVTPPAGECAAVSLPSSSSECRLWPNVQEQDEGGDFGLMAMENCKWEPRVVTWFGLEETTLVQPYKKPFIFNCMIGVPNCNAPVPSHEQAYVGQFQCHYGMNAGYEQESYLGGPGSEPGQNCGLVKYVDINQRIGTSAPGTLVHHLDLICALSLPGDSGSPWIAQGRAGHSIATGIEIAGSGAETPYCGKLGNSYSDEIGVALAALGAQL